MPLSTFRTSSKQLARRLAFAYERRVDREYILLFGHMRSYSSVLCHILNSNPEISGYVEMHQSYKSNDDFVRLALQLRRQNRGRLQGRYLVDKLLHNEAKITPKMVARPDVYGLFVIREPLQTIRSTIAMGLKRQTLDWKSKPDRVLRYYTRRLDGIVKTAQNKQTQSMFFEADQLLDNTEAVLGTLTSFLHLAHPLRDDYQTGELTGKRKYGDPSQYIRSGTIVKERDDYGHIELPATIIAQAEDAFGRAREQLFALCEYTVGAPAGARAAATGPLVVQPPTPDRAARAVASASSGLEEQPVFAGGSPRSGTTMLRAMLNCHPDLAMPRETRFLMEKYWERARFGDLSVPENRKPLVDQVALTKTYWFGRLEVDRQDAWARMMAAEPTIGSVLGTPYVMYAERAGKPRWGDKRPLYIDNHEAIFEMFPQAQFVNLIRDPRGAIASMKKLGWYNGSVAGGVEIWVRMLDAANEARARYGPEKFWDVRYEDLVSEAPKWLEQLCEFLGLDSGGVDAMLAFHEQAEQRSEKYHPRLATPVSADKVRSWENDLTPGELAFVEQETARHMEQHGYEPIAKGVKVPQQLGRELQRRRARKAKEKAGREAPNYPFPVQARLSPAAARPPKG